jgi:quinoprotein glucose dehydrogenase
MKRSLVIAIGVAASAATLLAQNNWTQVGQDAGATKYSTLDQINTSNVKSLKQAWAFHTGDKTGFFESTPIVIDGTMYLTAQNGVYALDPVTGAPSWKFEAEGGTRRGVAYWPGDAKTPARIISSTQERLIALNAKTGRLVPEFGQGGFVDMGTTMQSPVSIFKDIMIGPANTPVIRAWNVRTGALLWKFDLVAQPPDPANKTWESDAWKDIGGTNTWGYLSVDEQRGIVYVPTSIAGENDYVGMSRPGDNLYGNSLIALDINTGKKLWHQQLVHHDIWDYDFASQPTLFDINKDGKTIPAVAEFGKTGLLYIFNRLTGEPVFGMEERKVPSSAAPGEKNSPTQPFPLKPPPLARNSLTKAELPTNISPEHTAYCAGLWEKYKLQDTVAYTPWPVGQDVVVFPGAIGGGNWQGVTFNKKNHLIITNVMNAGQWGHLEEATAGGGRGGPGGGRGGRGGGPPGGGPPNAGGPPGGGPPGGGPPDGGGRSREKFRKVTPEGGRFWDPKTQYSCNPTPWGELIAVNADTGDIAWRTPLGIFEELAKKGIKSGAPSLGGAITTAGDLVFIAATIDGYFRAFDVRNGAELWSTRLEVPAHSFPSTYMGRDGKQYVAITVGGGGFLRSPTSDAVVAFRLP